MFREGMNREQFVNRSEEARKEGLKPRNFSILLEGEFRRGDVEIGLVPPGSSWEVTDDMQQDIDAGWDTAIENGIRAFPNDTKVSRYRTASLNQEGGTLHIAVDPCISYKDYIGSSTEDFVDKYGVEQASNPIAVITLIRAKDKSGAESILFTLRNEDHDYKPGGFHTGTGGYVNTPKDEHASPKELIDAANLFDTALKETVEESGLTADTLSDLVCRGAVYEGGAHCTNMVFETATTTSVEDIVAQRKKKLIEEGLDYEEAENDLFFVPTERVKLQQWLLAASQAGTASGLGALVLVGKELVRNQTMPDGSPVDAEAWAEHMMDAIAWRDADAAAAASVGGDLESRDLERLKRMVAARADTGFFQDAE